MRIAEQLKPGVMALLNAEIVSMGESTYTVKEQSKCNPYMKQLCGFSGKYNLVEQIPQIEDVSDEKFNHM